MIRDTQPRLDATGGELELHIALPSSCVWKPDMEDELATTYAQLHWRGVLATSPGRQRSIEFDDHGVEGQLAWIGTIRGSTEQIVRFAPLAAEILNGTVGSRLELEYLLDDVGQYDSSIRQESSALIVIDQLGIRVPAAPFETHISFRPKTQTDAAVGELISTNMEFFEVTVLGLRDPKIVVTCVGQSVEETRQHAVAITQRLLQLGQYTYSVSHEAVLGAWRPSAARLD